MNGRCSSSSSRFFVAVVLVAMATAGGGISSADDSTSAMTTTTIPDVINRDVIVAARCRVRCLYLLKTSIDMMTLLSTVKEMTSLTRCLQDSDCSTCMKPCNQPITTLDRCEDVCKFPKEDPVCSESCVFLKGIRAEEEEEEGRGASGLCPPVPSSISRPNASRGGHSCPDEGPGRRPCTSDLDCVEEARCCASPCGRRCQRPMAAGEGKGKGKGRRSLAAPSGLPRVPQTPQLRERTRKSGSVELSWSSVGDNGERSGPVLYVVDSRWNVGRRNNERAMSPWQQVSQTTGTAVVLNDITPGHWYQFRVTAVNIGGSSGGSAPTAPFTPSKEPRRPGPPTNLTEGDTLIAGGKMTVTIRWFPPMKSDLPVTRYKLFWSKRLKPSAVQSMDNRVFRKVLPGNRLTYQMQDLESDTTYVVQVQAICHYGDVRLKSEKSGIYVTTYPLPKPIDERYGGGGGGRGPGGMALDSFGGGGGGGGGRQMPPTPAPLTGLFVDRPFYDNGSLKANVTWDDGHAGEVSERNFLVNWSPEACIADSSSAGEGRGGGEGAAGGGGGGGGSLSRVMSSTTSESQFLIFDLRTDCRYLVKVEPVSTHGVTGKAALASFSTPTCAHSQANGQLHPDCLNNAAPRIPEEPPDLTHSFLISNSVITCRLSWGAAASESPVVGYRVVWGPVVRSHQKPPAIDRTQANVKVLAKNVRSLSVSNLLEGTTYLVQVQATTKFAQGRISSIQLATPLLQLAPIDQPHREQFNADKKQSDHSRKRTNLVVNATTPPPPPPLPPRTDGSLVRPQTHSSSSSTSSSLRTPSLWFVSTFGVLVSLLELCFVEFRFM